MLNPEHDMRYLSIEAVERATGARTWACRNVEAWMPGTLAWLLFKARLRFPHARYDIHIRVTDNQIA